MTVGNRPPKTINTFMDDKWRQTLKRTQDIANSITSQPFITTALSGDLDQERALTGSAAVTVTDNGAGSTIVLDLSDTGVVAAVYANANIAVDAKGRITAASTGSSGSSTPPSISRHFLLMGG